MSKFQRRPTLLNDKERESFAEAFIEGAPRSSPMPKREKLRSKIEKGVIFLRVPQQLIDDLARIEELTGYKPNPFCFMVINEAVKNKLRELEREILTDI